MVTNSTSKAGNSSELVLGDDGNLVLRDGSDPLSHNLLWQSFDHPTDTILPGAKTGYDKRRKVSTKLTSWRNSEDPTSSIYTLEVTPDGHFGVHWNGSQEYWTTGTWNGRTFGQTPEMRSNSLFNFKRVSNENETYVTYSLNNRAVLSRASEQVHLENSGDAESKGVCMACMDKDWNVIWSQPLGKCVVYGLCRAFGICSENGAYVCQCLQGFQTKSPKDWDLLDYSGGCVRETSLQCGGKDWFLKVPNVRLPVNSKASKVQTDENCKLACSNDCFCGAYAYTSAGCFTWHGNLLNIQQLDSGGDDLYLRSAASEVSNSSRKVSVESVIVGVVSRIIALAVFLVLVIVRRLRGIKVRTSRTEEDYPRLIHQFTFLTAFKYFLKDMRVACWCIQVEEVQRPSMGQIVQILEGLLEVNSPPIPKYLLALLENEEP
ncbi:hypothetical protein Sjap_003487 [Stephania japonica]|uniref:Apple domain-containing protein n=1 Tax=Stephania japonica TaxID=461633 RepID=A0AAP0PTM6_9MAGN